MPYSRKIISGYAALATALAFAPFFFALAETADTAPKDGLQSELSRLTDSLDLLSAMKANKRPADATALQTALNDVLRLSEEEVRGLATRIASQDGLTEKEDVERRAIASDLADLKLHMKSVRTDTTQEAGPTAVAAIAQKFKEWRDGPYADVMQRATAFASVFENDDSIKAANTRLAAILKDERKIRSLLPASKTSAFLRLIKKAQGELHKAAELNAEAKELLDPTTPAPDDGTSAASLAADASDLVNAAYDDFIAMSKLIRK